MDIYDIPIAQITEQYVAYVSLIERLDPNTAGDFLVMAATLMEIKSRTLLPRPPAVEEEEDFSDPRLELVRQLLEYKKYKDAARSLDAAMQLQSMRRQENAWWVALRESNTLTARSYRRGHGDSYFLFFTDDQPLLRPVFGAFNLLAATFESLVGLAWAPVDRGDTLVSGLEGMVVSLPELAFWNIRKGSNDWVAPQPQPLD